MIGKLSGLVDETGEGWLILDVGGVGYMVHTSARMLAQLPNIGEPLTLFIDTHVREDHIHLFGFPSRDELATFHLLQSVQGVGAKVALGILAVLSPPELAAAIAAGDKAQISRGPGVGPKLATRLINELKDKLGDIPGAGGGADLATPADARGGAFQDAVSALTNLGYRPGDAHGAVAKAEAELGQEQGKEANVQDLIRRGLKELSS